MRRPPAEAGGSAARPPAVPARPLCVGRRTRRGAHLERWRIWRRLRCRRRVLFFFHFHRNFARDFLYGFDLCAMPGAPCSEKAEVVSGWAVCQGRGALFLVCAGSRGRQWAGREQFGEWHVVLQRCGGQGREHTCSGDEGKALQAGLRIDLKAVFFRLGLLIVMLCRRAAVFALQRETGG